MRRRGHSHSLQPLQDHGDQCRGMEPHGRLNPQFGEAHPSHTRRDTRLRRLHPRNQSLLLHRDDGPAHRIVQDHRVHRRRARALRLARQILRAPRRQGLEKTHTDAARQAQELAHPQLRACPRRAPADLRAHSQHIPLLPRFPQIAPLGSEERPPAQTLISLRLNGAPKHRARRYDGGVQRNPRPLGA